MEHAAENLRTVCVEKYVEKQIKIKALTLSRRLKLDQVQYEEILIDLETAIERRFYNTYDKRKSGIKTYLERFLSSELSHIKRKKFAKKRGFGKTTSLEKEIEELERLGIGNNSEFFMTIDDDPFRFESIELAVSEMPNDLKKVCKILMKENVSEASRILKITRGKLRRDMDRIRKIFKKMKITAPI